MHIIISFFITHPSKRLDARVCILIVKKGKSGNPCFSLRLRRISTLQPRLRWAFWNRHHLLAWLKDCPVLLTKLGEMLRKDYDWSKDVATINSPTLLVFGDADAVRTAHAVQLFELLGGGKRDAGWDGSGMSNARLAILPGLTHYTIFSSPALASTVTPFLDAPMPRTN